MRHQETRIEEALMLKPGPVLDQDGHITLFAALLILALLAIISMSASRVANTEVAMARNEAVFRRNFYLAEGAAIEAADRLNSYGSISENIQPWMEMVTGNLDVDSVQGYWNNAIAYGDTVIPEPSVVDPNHTLFVIGDEGVARGSSLDMAKSTVHAIAIYGRGDWDGVAIIKIGYRAAY
jgi:hypothetical protein